MSLIKAILISLGTVSLFLGIVGIVIPGLPTTPFILLTAGLYIRSSEKLYNKMITNRFIGSYISDFRTGKGMTRRVKAYSISIMWIMVIISIVYLIEPLVIRLIVFLAGIAGTIVMGFIIPTISNSNIRNK